MDTIEELRQQYRPIILEELRQYSSRLSELSSDDEPEDSIEDEIINTTFVQYNPNKIEGQSKTLGIHRNSRKSSHRSPIRTPEEVEDAWNTSYSSFIPRMKSHRRLHSTDQTSSKKKHLRTSSVQLLPSMFRSSTSLSSSKDSFPDPNSIV